MYVTIDRETTELPASPDGQPWAYGLLTETATILADSVTGLIAGLVPGYDELDDDDALFARYQIACAAADAVQARLAVDAGLNANEETEDDLSAIFAPRSEGGLVLDGPWANSVPLVLIRSDYAPFTGAARPEGNVKFIDPTHERILLESFDELGVASFLVKQD